MNRQEHLKDSIAPSNKLVLGDRDYAAVVVAALVVVLVVWAAVGGNMLSGLGFLFGGWLMYSMSKGGRPDVYATMKDKVVGMLSGFLCCIFVIVYVGVMVTVLVHG